METPTQSEFGARVVAAFAMLALFGVGLFWFNLHAARRDELHEERVVVPERAPTPIVPAAARGHDGADAKAPKRKWGGALVAGRVSDVDGRGIEGASVRVALESRGRIRPVGEAVSSPEGTFRLAVQEAADLSRIERAGASLLVQGWRRGFALAERRLGLEGDAEHPLDVVLVLERGGLLSGRVVDPAGRPAAGAAVRLRPEPGLQGEVEIWPPVAVADAEGTYRVGFTGSSFYDLEAEAEGIGHASLRGLQLDPGSHTHLADLVLEERRVLEGTVRYPDGSPARQLTLVAVLAAEAGDGTGSKSARATTDADGWFRFVGLARGAYLLGYDGEGLPAFALAEPVESGRRDLELELDVHRVLAHVHEEKGPLPGILASCHPLRELAPGEFAPAGAGWGSFALDRADGPEAIASFVVEPGGFYALHANVEGGVAAEEVVGIEPVRYEVEVTLVLRHVERRGRLEIRLVDADGTDLEPFWVSLLSPRTGLYLDGRRVDTAEDRTLFLPEDLYRVVSRTQRSEDPYDPGFLLPATRPDPVEVRAGVRTRVELVARPGGRLSLRFDADDAELGPRGIRVWARRADGSAPIPIDFFVFGTGYALSFGALRYGEENLSRTVLEPGDYTLEIEGPEVPRIELPARVAPGQVTEVSVPL